MDFDPKELKPGMRVVWFYGGDEMPGLVAEEARETHPGWGYSALIAYDDGGCHWTRVDELRRPSLLDDLAAL